MTHLYPHFRRTTDLPIHSFEANPRAYGFAAEHLRNLANVHLHLGDSRSGLRRLASTRVLPAIGDPLLAVESVAIGC